MKSIKAYMPVLLLGLLTFMAGEVMAQDIPHTSTSYDGGLGWYNPCIQGTAAIVSGTTTLDYHQNGSHEAIHVRYEGTGQNYSLANWQPTGQMYAVTFEANGQYDLTTLPDSVTVPFHAVWVGSGSAPNFSMEGTLLIPFQNGVPVGSFPMAGSLDTACTN